MYLNLKQQKLISQIFGILLDSDDAFEIRSEIGPAILDLLRADTYVSFVWSDQQNRYTDYVTHTMPLELLQAYDDYYHQLDIVTPTLESFDRPSIAEVEVGHHRLRKSAFYNEFLQQERMTSGVNLFLRDAEGELGDLRIWRDPHRPAFEETDLLLLSFLQPALVAALRRCKNRERSDAISLVTNVPVASLPSLSSRERDVARLVAQGKPDKQVARELGISFTTVRTHLGRVYQKLGVSNRVELARQFPMWKSLQASRLH